MAVGRLLSGLFATLLIAGGLTACAPWQPAPVEDRREQPPPRASRPAPGPAPAVYEIRRGDTLYSIAFRYGLDWRSVASWNGMSAPYTIRPGQEIRLTAPPVAREVRPPAPEPAPPRSVPPASTQPAVRPSAPAESSPSSPQPAPSSGASRRVAGVDWRWPTAGAVARAFDASAARRGIGIRGQAGQTVVAAADGEVVYSGTALIGYGELIIIKHSATMLSAYGHNRRRLVAEGARVRAGQPIGEMGLDETDQAVLHFEIRRNGEPENPLEFLPPRD
ncbi:peptidoglycan DD-metalloendopeptidase family protein [Wenzhouxiangella marina]|uniref:peptidoglycan DD-metalloendopeptidase family protein n=1 Tax=Wenzhouxiangella marina TaxID=1579979 RepID=UPI001614B8BE|nr:peptidoglycan DD-metalloendopeptidase family protein [Wenzhouxiangella marina]MBB6086554.1 lipoprotein NlpD [Wenzhouxiangella marina]